MKLRIFRNIIVLALIVFVSTTWGEVLRVFEVKPDLVLIIVVWISLRQGAMSAQISGFASGVIEDMLSLSPLGFHAASRAIIGFTIGSIREFVGIDKVIIPVLFTTAAYVMQAVWFSLVSLVFNLAVSHSPLFSLNFFGGLVYTFTLAPVVFLAADLISSVARPASERFK